MAGDDSYVVQSTLGNPMPGKFVVSWSYETPDGKGKKPFTNKEVPHELLKGVKLPKKGKLDVKLRIKTADHKIVKVWPAAEEEPGEKVEFKIGSKVDASRAAAVSAAKASQHDYSNRFSRDDVQFGATAPYNFVQMATPVSASTWQSGLQQKLSGRIELRLTSKTPVLVAGHVRREDRNNETRRFFQVGNTPVIPGSTIKGLVRNVFEIVTASAMRPVSQNHIHYRDVSDTDYYQKVMVERISRPNGAEAFASKSRAGFLVTRGKSYEIIPCSVSKIAHARIFAHFGMGEQRDLWVNGYNQNGRTIRPKAHEKYDHLLAHANQDICKLRQRFVVSAEQDWSASKDGGSGKKGGENFLFHYSKALFLDNKNNVPEADRKQLRDFKDPKFVDGTLVFSGWMTKKYTEFVFHTPQENLKKPLARDVRRVFDDQLTPAQGAHLRKLQELAHGGVYPHGGIPVFYLEDDQGEISDIGLTQLFRLRARHRPASLTAVQGNFADLATEVFGSTSKAGRVSFSHARCVSGQADREFTTVLGQPHASCAAHYLVPSSEDEHKRRGSGAGGRKNDANVLAGWNASDVMLRGWKRYWHRPAAKVEEPPNNNRDTQVRLQPLRAGATFTTTIEFRDLTIVELGALLFALNPGVDAAKPAVHKLGMGKALGWGSVEFSITGFEAWEPATRYRSLLGRLGTPAKACTAEQARAAFIAKLNELFPKGQPHIDDLRQMLDFERAQKPDWSQKTRPLTLQEFKPKALLQSVSNVYKSSQGS